MKPAKLVIALALGASAACAAGAALPPLYEELVARQEERLIMTSPIAGVQNRLWFDYRIDITEAQKELSSDLKRASDIEDRRDAWEEYARQLREEREDYVKAMAKRGYRSGTVTVD